MSSRINSDVHLHACKHAAPGISCSHVTKPAHCIIDKSLLGQLTCDIGSTRKDS